MKKFVTLLLAGAMATALAVSANAADVKALNGTPKVDGKLDDIYKQSGVLVTEAGKSKVWAAGTGEKASDAKASTYALWDDKYIYFASEVTESTVVDVGKVKLWTPTTTNQWRADAIELWLKYEGKADKVSVDAFATKVYGNNAVVPLADCKFAAINSKTGYVVELAIPIASFKAGSVIDYSIQLNDFMDTTGDNGAAWGSQKMENKLTLSADKVVLPKEPAKAPATADPTVLALLAAAAAGVVVSKKKH